MTGNKSPQAPNRRPIKFRSSPFAQSAASWLTHKRVTPNQISLASIGFAGLAAVCLVLAPYATSFSAVFLMLLAAIFIQSRLLCNLLDGMVAIEFAQETPSGSLFNDAPDRLSDSLILIAAGYATTDIAGVTFWGWAAALSSVMTAYARTLCASAGAPMRFQGPMSKSHRMALITLACLLTACETLLAVGHYSFFVALLITTIGSLITTWRRLRDGYMFLQNKH